MMNEIKSASLFGQITTLKSTQAVEPVPIPYEWISYGMSLSLCLLFVIGLTFGSKNVKRSVWVSQLLFVLCGLSSLSWAFFCVDFLVRGNSDFFAFLCRLQIMLSTIATFNLVTPTQSKQNFGFFYSAFLGAILGASFINFFWPIEGLLLLGEMILLGASLYLGGRVLFGGERDGFGDGTLFLQLTNVILMGFLTFWMPELDKLQETSRAVFGFLSCALFLVASSVVLSSARERTEMLVNRMQRELIISDRRVTKANQTVQALTQDLASQQELLQKEATEHRQDIIRDHLRIRALEECSQDIAHGLLVHLKELMDDCQLVVNESKSPKYRLAFIRAYSERTLYLTTRIRSVAGFLLSTEAALDPSRDGVCIMNAADLLKECLFLSGAKFRKVGVEVEIESLANDLWIEGKPALIAQGFIGLIYNALEATAAADVRRVTLVLRKVRDEDKDWVELGISNSGPGSPTSVKAKAFKLKDRDGIGIHSLGLSMAFGIFEHAGGSLNLDNEAVATTLLARLPLAQKNDEPSLRLVI